MRNPLIHLVSAILIVSSVAMTPAAGAFPRQATTQSTIQEAPDELLRDPDRPLDPRIDPDKVTELDLPPLPEQVVLPMPPWFRLSERAAEVPIPEDVWNRAMQAIRDGVAYLRTQQDEQGGWLADLQATPTDQPDAPSPIAIAVTALAMKAIAQPGDLRMKDPSVKRAANFIRTAQRRDGSFDGGSLSNYVTSCVITGLTSVNEIQFATEIHRATKWLQVTQWDQGEGVGARQDWFGGSGYGNRGRPDLSNTQMMLDALYDAHMSPDEPAVQRALLFVSRAQNLKATNAAEWAGNDGGFIYTPANGGESMASEAAGEGRWGENIPEGQPRSLRSYGSMTYAGFKSMIYAGLSQNDIRVRAAFDWIRRHWTFEENPGLGQQGLYYYYLTMARTLTIAQQHIITDIEGVDHNWRVELIEALLKRQASDGSWKNEADRWLEGEPVMATTYALLSLEEALKPILKLKDD